MEKKVLNNKISIQAMVLVLGIVLVVLGITCACLCYNFFAIRIPYVDGRYTRYYYEYLSGEIPAFIVIGVAMTFAGITAIVVASIKITNYKILKKSLTKTSRQAQLKTQHAYTTQSPTNQEWRNKLSALNQMKANGLITDAEYNEKKIALIKKYTE